MLLIDHGLNWYYLSVFTGALGVVWAIGLRALTIHSLQSHRTQYKLSESIRHSKTTSSSRELSSSGAKVSGSGLSVGGGGVGGRENSKDRLKLEVHPAAMMTSCSHLPLRNLIRQPPIMWVCCFKIKRERKRILCIHTCMCKLALISRAMWQLSWYKLIHMMMCKHTHVYYATDITLLYTEYELVSSI